VTTGTTKGERTRAKILGSAVERFGANGFRPTSVAAIARDAGVSAAAPFAYWSSKEALFDAAVDLDAHAVIDELLAGIDPSDPSLWLTLVNRLVEILSRHPLARRVLAGQEPDVIDRVLELSAFTELRELLAALIAEEQATGITRKDLDPHRAAVGIESIVLSITMALLQLKAPPDPERELGVAEILLAAFRAPQ
jgi:AcrR family transcriptional regulator